MRHPCNSCSLKFNTEKDLEIHAASFHINPDASSVQPILPVVLEKIKIEPELIRLDEDEDDDQSMSTAQKQPPKAIFEKTAITQIVKRLKPKDCYQCGVCLQTFSLLRYFRKHLATAKEQGFFKCQEYYKTNTNKGYVPVYNKSCVEGIANAENGQPTDKEHSQSLQRTTPVSVQTCENSKDEEHVMMKSKTGSKNNKQRSSVMEKQRLSKTVDNNINFQRRRKNYFKIIRAVNCAAKAVTNENSKDNIAIPLGNQSETATGNAGVPMRAVKTTEIVPTHQDASCKECHLTCASYEQLCVHYSKHHNLPVVVLKHVDKNKLYQKYKQNLKSSNKNNSFKCDTCKRNFSSRYYLKKHTASKPGANCHFSDDYLKTYETDISSSEIPAPKEGIDLCKKNILIYPKKPYELRKNKLKLSLLRKHNISANSQLCHKCNICKRQFSSLTMLTKHKLTVHKITKVSLNNVQQRQGKLLSTSKEFHKLSAQDRFRFKCVLCQKDFSSKHYLKLHKRGAHDGFRHKCKICPKDFPLLVSLKKHKLHAHDGVRHKCELCPKTFSEMKSLNQHKQTVHDGVRHKCKSCPRTFTRLKNLKQHTLSEHEGVRRNCELCPKTFTQLRYLNQHKQTVHDGVRHRCELCPRTFTQLGNLNQHKHTAHDGVRYRCELCPKTFSQKVHLNQHKRRCL